MTPVLRRLALERDGVVESSSLVLMPKQRFLQAGAAVEVSSASSGTEGQNECKSNTASINSFSKRRVVSRCRDERFN